MRILIAEDDPLTLRPYRIALEAKDHQVFATDNGEDCLKIYKQELEKHYSSGRDEDSPSPFDAVVLDYRMPKKDGMEVAKEILELNPKQRIIFASAYVKDTLVESVKELKQTVELMQKPFKVQALVDTIEDTEIYEELRKLEVNADAFKTANPTHEQLSELLEALQRIHKGRTF